MINEKYTTIMNKRNITLLEKHYKNLFFNKDDEILIIYSFYMNK